MGSTDLLLACCCGEEDCFYIFRICQGHFVRSGRGPTIHGSEPIGPQDPDPIIDVPCRLFPDGPPDPTKVYEIDGFCYERPNIPPETTASHPIKKNLGAIFDSCEECLFTPCYRKAIWCACIGQPTPQFSVWVPCECVNGVLTETCYFDAGNTCWRIADDSEYDTISTQPPAGDIIMACPLNCEYISCEQCCGGPCNQCGITQPCPATTFIALPTITVTLLPTGAQCTLPSTGPLPCTPAGQCVCGLPGNHFTFCTSPLFFLDITEYNLACNGSTPLSCCNTILANEWYIAIRLRLEVSLDFCPAGTVDADLYFGKGPGICPGGAYSLRCVRAGTATFPACLTPPWDGCPIGVEVFGVIGITTL